MLYLAGRLVDDEDKKNIRWRLLGVFSEPGHAETICETDFDFVRPVPLNERLPEIGKRPNQIYFPRRED